MVGGILGWLAGVGLLAIPGLGLFVAAGPIMAMLSGIGVGGVLGGVAGALAGLGTPEYEAKRYEGRIRKGGILLSVHCDDREWVKPAREILVQTGAEDVSATTEAKADFATSDRPRSRTIATKAYDSVSFWQIQRLAIYSLSATRAWTSTMPDSIPCPSSAGLASVSEKLQNNTARQPDGIAAFHAEPLGGLVNVDAGQIFAAVVEAGPLFAQSE